MRRWIAALLLVCALCAQLAHASESIPQKGERGEAVQQLQRRLAQLGFYYAPIDDFFGKQTERALERYQGYLKLLRAVDASASALLVSEIVENGKLSQEQYAYLFSEGYNPCLGSMGEGDEGQAVFRLQLRLDQLGYLMAKVDGSYGADTAQAVTRFQRRNDLLETGDADTMTQRALFSGEALASFSPMYRYKLYISNDDQRAYAYEWADSGYNRLLRSMVCSTGLPNTPTADGVYRSEGQVSRWCYFPIYSCWAQYAFRIEGAVLFHSVLYDTANESTLKKSSVKSLGSKSSHGCVRMSVEDAQWIYEHCRKGTTVVIY